MFHFVFLKCLSVLVHWLLMDKRRTNENKESEILSMINVNIIFC